ncbi:MAG: hypothetical protein Q9218_002032 [Villophora microphyllina]
MYSTRPLAASLANPRAATKLLQSVTALPDASKAACLRSCSATLIVRQHQPSPPRFFTSTAHQRIKEVFPPPPDSPNIKVTPPAWHHPVYTEDQMNAIVVAHRETKNWADQVALAAVRLLRWGMDTATGYTHDKGSIKPKGDSNQAALSQKKGWFTMSERKWLVRALFLESVAGVPGMVAASVRHLHSLRRLKRDNGWIETLLEEAYNERMHLLTFMKMAEPGRFMKFMILGAQGVFYNGFFLSYLISPRICHRFVGFLEEEAVLTYTRMIADIDAGKLPKWEKLEAPEIAIRYWNMPEGHRSMRDLLLYIRADEAKHREVNHTLGNLEQKTDPNPFNSEYEDPSKPHPTKGIDNIKPIGWERREVIQQVDGRAVLAIDTKIRLYCPHPMPPKSSLTSSFSASDVDNEVVCPLKNQDGSNCRKRCLGRTRNDNAIELQEKRYRSMQEHIRRAHAEHYIPKLPATEESFQLMINTPPSERPDHSTTQTFGNTGWNTHRA